MGMNEQGSDTDAIPGKSGLALAQEVRRRYPRMPVILTGGYSHGPAQNGRRGFTVLPKPSPIAQLSRVVRTSIAWQTRR